MQMLVRGVRWALAVVFLAGGLAACGDDKGDPAAISRDFMLAVWTGDAARVRELSCQEWRAVTAAWATEGDPGWEVDTEHLVFDVRGETDDQAEVIMTGVVTFRSADGQTEVRDLTNSDQTLFILVDEGGWKVCDVR